jgi:hypothetical protein
MTLNAVPTDPVAVDLKGRLTSVYQTWFSSIHDWLGPIGGSGSTAKRPVNSSRNPMYIGQQYFDTTLGKPIWVKTVTPAIVWVDATGAVV